MNPIYRKQADVANELMVQRIMERLLRGRWKHVGNSNKPYDLMVMVPDSGVFLIEVKARNGIPWPVWAERAKAQKLRQAAAQMQGVGLFLWAEDRPVREDSVLYTARLDVVEGCHLNEDAGSDRRNDPLDWDPCYEVPRSKVKVHNADG